jgi:hypothetical protein
VHRRSQLGSQRAHSLEPRTSSLGLLTAAKNGVAMSPQRPPIIDLNIADLSADAKKSHELLVTIFGQYVFWLRNWAIDASRELVESEEARQKLGTLRRGKYEEIASFSPKQREAACNLAQATVDRFIQLFLTMLSGTGVDQRVGKSHAVRFKLDMEILEVETEEVVVQETINRAGEKFFADYWSRWLNQFTSPTTATSSP